MNLLQRRVELVASFDPGEPIVSMMIFQGRCLVATNRRIFEVVNDYPRWIIKVLEFVRLR